jgi:Bacterial aa3 type cytochrome c oxidase subunit IV
LKAVALLTITRKIDIHFKGKIMAKAKTSDNDMPAHEATYAHVMELLKWGAAGSFLVGMIVVLIIAR